MSRFELDHVFVVASAGAPETDGLVASGFTEGSPNTHPGQGTACRRVFFENAYLELLWLEDLTEACSSRIERTGLAARAGNTAGASQVGICLRAVSGSPTPLPIETWSYRPPYLSESVSIPMAVNSAELHEPLLFFLPSHSERQQQEYTHRNGTRLITDLSITVAGGQDFSPELEWLASSGCVRVERGVEESVTIELDEGLNGETISASVRVRLELTW
jgi:glyoxalase-like protein